MLKRVHHALFAALQAFRSDWRIYLAQQRMLHARPLWDNGIDYDVPTFLRQRMG